MSDELPFNTNLILQKDIKSLYMIGHREYPNSLFLIDEGDACYPLISDNPETLWKGLQKALGTEDEGKLICFNIYNFQREIIENGRNKNIRGSKC
tara:strand:+ start:3090 stop:3374 length:285 start_codon:yes stop_codon:yes gene_type:complete